MGMRTHRASLPYPKESGTEVSLAPGNNDMGTWHLDTFCPPWVTPRLPWHRGHGYGDVDIESLLAMGGTLMPKPPELCHYTTGTWTEGPLSTGVHSVPKQRHQNPFGVRDEDM